MNYRRKDYFIPRSLKEAYGHDETFDSDIRCVSELWGHKKQRPLWPSVIGFVVLFFVIVQVIKLYGN